MGFLEEFDYCFSSYYSGSTSLILDSCKQAALTENVPNVHVKLLPDGDPEKNINFAGLGLSSGFWKGLIYLQVV